MGFKELKENKHEALEVEVTVRGDTEPKDNRSKKLVLNFTESEYVTLKEQAKKFGMSLNVYCRFKIFNN